MQAAIIFFFFGISLYPAPAFASENIRVVLADDLKAVVVGSESGLVVEGRPAERKEKKLVFRAASASGRPVRVRSSGAFLTVNDIRYRGWVELRKKSNGLLMAVNDLDLEDYLLGVVAAEVPSRWELEALKAQAVAARTYALYQKRTAGRRPYHLFATVSSQVYAGVAAEGTRADAAVRATRGMVIVYGNEPIQAFYHSSCGGLTENVAELWGIDAPYLRGVDCDCQEISRYGLWEKRIGKTRVKSALEQQGYRPGDILDMAIRGLTSAGRVREVVIRSTRGRLLMPAASLRAALGNDLIPSVFFELAMDGDDAVFSGRGNGHGIGLCQWGAEYMARKGADFRGILSHYYPGTGLARMW
jgi:stage II sporulation protein D